MQDETNKITAVIFQWFIFHIVELRLDLETPSIFPSCELDKLKINEVSTSI